MKEDERISRGTWSQYTLSIHYQGESQQVRLIKDRVLVFVCFHKPRDHRFPPLSHSLHNRRMNFLSPRTFVCPSRVSFQHTHILHAHESAHVLPLKQPRKARLHACTTARRLRSHCKWSFCLYSNSAVRASIAASCSFRLPPALPPAAPPAAAPALDLFRISRNGLE